MKNCMIRCLLLFAIAVCVCFSSCTPEEEEPSKVAEFVTSEATNVSFNQVILNGVFSAGTQKVEDCGFVWSNEPNPALDAAEEIHLGVLEEDQLVTHTVGELENNSIYYFRTFLVLKSGTVYGEEQSFTTRQHSMFNALAATDIAFTDARLSGELFQHDSEIFDCGFVWSQNPNPTTTTAEKKYFGPQETNKTLSYPLAGLAINKKYYFRTFIITQAGIAYSDDQTFSTLPEITWTDPGAFPGLSRMNGISFVIGSKAYVGLGHTRDTEGHLIYLNDLWEFNMLTNTWTQKKDYPGGGRSGAIAFSINGKGYAGTGGAIAGATKDFWEYNPATNEWTQKADFLGGKVGWASAFSLLDKGYVGTGVENGNGKFLKTFYEYDPEKNEWTKKADFPGLAIDQAVGFSIGDYGYIGLGLREESWLGHTKEIWAYSPASDTWTKKKNCPSSKSMDGSIAFVMNNRAYVSLGWGGEKIVWSYDPSTDNWSQNGELSESKRIGAVAFVSGNKAIIGTGATTTSYFSNFIDYTPQ